MSVTGDLGAVEGEGIAGSPAGLPGTRRAHIVHIAHEALQDGTCCFVLLRPGTSADLQPTPVSPQQAASLQGCFLNSLDLDGAQCEAGLSSARGRSPSQNKHAHHQA